MFEEIEFKKIREIIREFFDKTGLEVEVDVKKPHDTTIPVDITTEDPRILVGQSGRTLTDIQHLLKIILNREIKKEERFYIDLDINNYKKKKIEYLEELADSIADETALSKKERILGPMSSYERRIIHLKLAERKDVATESIGEEPERRVVVKPS